ncbi:uncharacterized protein LOC123356621 [Mauremys mutica]|uniref:uncharacterized protein LOC123356621 n=1 Tax=Mauremys mutica TaxID=74926 RepID=UPI001D16EF67|nr:uncharacterized protein LOC123356621 [Mauremys mutica]
MPVTGPSGPPGAHPRSSCISVLAGGKEPLMGDRSSHGGRSPSGEKGEENVRAPPAARPAPPRARGEAADAEEQRGSQELLEQAAAERRQLVWEWQELRGFLEEQEQRLLARLEELEGAIVQRRDAGGCSLSREISLLGERGGDEGQRPPSPPLQGAGSCGARSGDHVCTQSEPTEPERPGDSSRARLCSLPPRFPVSRLSGPMASTGLKAGDSP